ncbi:hypothetical protein HNP70_001069 [Borreliella kurtenbachii]
MQSTAKFIQLGTSIVIRSDKKDLFINVEKYNDKTMYHIKIMFNIYKLGINKKKINAVYY